MAFVDVMPGKSFTFRFKADDPGVFMYHCGTKVVMILRTGCRRDFVVDPARRSRRPTARTFSLRASGI